MGQTDMKFQNPPVIEVAFQVVFPTLVSIGTPHFGAFWSSIRDDFPTIQAAARLGPVEFNGLQGAFPENRLWLVHKSGETLIQLQDNRFLYNWRQTGEETAYPGYEKLYPEFSKYLQMFCEFLEIENSPIDAFTGFELHYVNHIYLGDSIKKWEDAGDAISLIDKVTPDQKAFPLTSLRFSTTSKILDSDDVLHVGVDSRSHNVTKKELLNFEIRVSAVRDSLKSDALEAEFSKAHDKILMAFLEISTNKSKRSWGAK